MKTINFKQENFWDIEKQWKEILPSDFELDDVYKSNGKDCIGITVRKYRDSEDIILAFGIPIDRFEYDKDELLFLVMSNYNQVLGLYEES